MQKSTIEMEHKKNINKYKDNSLNSIELKKQIEILTKQLEVTKNLKEIFNIKEKIQKIEIISKKENEIDYLLNVVPILQKYNKEVVNEVLNCKNDTENILNNFIQKSKGKEKGLLYNEFMNIVENKAFEVVKNGNTYLCFDCNAPKVLSVLESVMICPICGLSETYFDTGLNNLSYEQEVNSEGNITFAYKRINHFNEWLAQFQAKESIDIPIEILDKLRNEFHKAKVTNTSEITKVKVKMYLKKLKFNKYYEHITHITNLITGIKPPSMTSVVEEKLRNMFRDIQIPFEEHKPKERSNFLSYSYCLYKFCELLGYDELLCNFPLLKSREKLHQQDIIWQKISKSLGWEYIATV